MWYEEMETIIQIEGDAVQIVERTVTRVVKVSDWVRKISESEPLAIMLPMGCRFYKQINGNKIWVIETPPRVRTIRFLDDSFRVAFPFTVSLLESIGGSVENFRLFYRTSPLKSIDDDLYRSNLPNIGLTAYVCLGELKVDLALPMHEKIDLMQSLFWESQFNNDLFGSFIEYAEKDVRLKSFISWQTATRENSLFPLEVKWIKIGTLKECISSFE